MLLSLFAKGYLIGFSIAMPLGPIGMLSIRNSVVRGVSYGIASGIGAAAADTLCGALAGFGVSALSTFLESNKIFLQIFGGFVLWAIGIVTYLKGQEPPGSLQMQLAHWKIFLTTFLLTLTNPITFLSLAAMYAALGIGGSDNGISEAMLLTWGIFAGSVVCTVILSYSSSACKSWLRITQTSVLNKIAGVVIFFFGVMAMGSGLAHLFIF